MYQDSPYGSIEMKIGVITDSHDDLHNVRRAVQIFNQQDVETVIHAGDYVFPGIVAEFKKLRRPESFVGVLGNNDGEKIGLVRKFDEVGGRLSSTDMLELEMNNLKIGVYHGTDANLRETTIQSGKYDVFIHGHTHVKRNVKKGRTLVLNPGTAHLNFPTFPPNEDGWLEDKPTIIIFDTLIKETKFILLINGIEIPVHQLKLQKEEQ